MGIWGNNTEKGRKMLKNDVEGGSDYMKRINDWDQLSLNQLWNNIFFKLSSKIIGNDNSADFFIISENEDKYEITSARNQIEKWRCMVEPSIALKHKTIKDKSTGVYSREFKEFVYSMYKGHIEYDSNASDGRAKRYVNLRYEELLEYLIQKGSNIVEQEIAFLRQTILNSCSLKLYLNDQWNKGHITNEKNVKKSILRQYEEGIELKRIETLVKSYLKRFYSDIEDVDAIDLLSVVIVRTLAEVTVEADEGRKIKNADKIFQLQRQFLKSVEGYLNGEGIKAPEVINVSLCVEWRTKFSCTRREIIDTGYPETGELIHLLDNLGRIRSAEIGDAIFGVLNRCEIRSLREQLNAEVKQLDDLLKSLELFREYTNGLRERNVFETENENKSLLEQALTRVLKLDNLI